MKVVVIGGGPSGLVTCKALLDAVSDEFPFDPIVLEQEADIGGTFRYRGYQNATLVSSKQLTAFSDFRLPFDHSDHLTLEEYVDYLRAYCEHFKITDRIRLESKVVSVSRSADGSGHVVSYVNKTASGDWDEVPKTINATYIALCTGLHVIPAVPSVPGIEHVLDPANHEQDALPPAAYHSTEYKSRAQLVGRRVMILGTGETGMDLAYEAAKAGAREVVLCSRSGFLSFPKALNDFEVFGFQFKSEKRSVPIDSLITNLGETAYVHPWVASSHIRWFVSDFVIKRLLWFLTGTQAGCNQWVGELEPDRLGRAYVFLNKSHKAMPYINRPYRSRPRLLEYMSRYIDPPEDMPPQTDFTVDLAPFPSHFLPNGRAVFPLIQRRKDAVRMQGRDVKPEVVIYATGYRQEFSFLDKEGGYATPGEADVRNVVKSGDESVAFIGFVRPGVGAIPPISEMQAFFWISLLKGQVKKPLPPPHYHLLVKDTARIKYGVDHSAYMSTLAKDIGAAPGLWELWWEHGTHVLLCYCFGAAFTTFYRLTGPYRSPLAPETVKTELWDTITRRGLLGNVIMGLIPMIFYLAINGVALGIELVLTLGRVVVRV
ncbi:FAD/NAD(P)-binding domain-containing protein [Mycena filopes]|nr:FAD/NAD(P)-binding domain-containing protein [Mycena filopes]